jgi:hypothetical protein
MVAAASTNRVVASSRYGATNAATTMVGILPGDHGEVDGLRPGQGGLARLAFGHERRVGGAVLPQ